MNVMLVALYLFSVTHVKQPLVVAEEQADVQMVTEGKLTITSI